MKEVITAKGHWLIEGSDGSRYEWDNVVVQGFFTAVISRLNGGIDALNVTHIATGTGTNTAAKSDTALQAEYFRKALSSKSTTSSTFVAKLSLAPSESVTTIRELGVFINATDTPGSGVLLSRCNVNIVKNASTQYLMTYTLTIQ